MIDAWNLERRGIQVRPCPKLQCNRLCNLERRGIQTRPCPKGALVCWGRPCTLLRVYYPAVVVSRGFDSFWFAVFRSKLEFLLLLLFFLIGLSWGGVAWRGDGLVSRAWAPRHIVMAAFRSRVNVLSASTWACHPHSLYLACHRLFRVFPYLCLPSFVALCIDLRLSNDSNLFCQPVCTFVCYAVSTSVCRFASTSVCHPVSAFACQNVQTFVKLSLPSSVYFFRFYLRLSTCSYLLLSTCFAFVCQHDCTFICQTVSPFHLLTSNRACSLSISEPQPFINVVCLRLNVISRAPTYQASHLAGI